MKKILFCTASLKTGTGGVASYAHEFIDSFKNEYSFSVITGDDGTLNDKVIKIHRLNGDDCQEKNVLSLLSIVNEERPEIVINSSFSVLSIASPFLPDNIKLITISHYTNRNLANQAGLNGNYVDSIIGLSTYAKKYLEEYSAVYDKGKVKVVYNFMPSVQNVIFENKKNSDVLNIVYPGGSIYQKSADVVCKTVLKLIRTNLPFNFYWLGNDKLPGYNWPLVRSRTLHDILPQDNRIKQLGPVSREISKQILENANLFLLPSRGEGFPISLIEAMRGCCIPVISDAKHGALDIIENRKNGFVTKQGDSNDLFRCIVELLSNHQSYNKIYEESYKTYQQYLTKEVWKERMEEVFNTPNNHLPRMKLVDNHDFLRIGARRMSISIKKMWLMNQFYEPSFMKIKFLLIRYLYRPF